MRIRALTCAMVVVAAVPAFGQEVALRVQLIPGHPVYHETENEAGVAMALSIASQPDHVTDLSELCEELRLAAGLWSENGDDLRLETIFVVPYKAMAVEGYYWPNGGTPEEGTLVRGSAIPRGTLDRIVARAGIPPRVLDEINVEHEISCEMRESAWHINWSDVRLVSDEDPDAVIERAYRRFRTIHRSVLEHNGQEQHVETGQRTRIGG